MSPQDMLGARRAPVCRRAEACCGANDGELRVTRESRETATRAPELPTGHGPAVLPTSRGSVPFPAPTSVFARQEISARPPSRTTPLANYRSPRHRDVAVGRAAAAGVPSGLLISTAPQF